MIFVPIQTASGKAACAFLKDRSAQNLLMLVDLVVMGGFFFRMEEGPPCDIDVRLTSCKRQRTVATTRAGHPTNQYPTPRSVGQRCPTQRPNFQCTNGINI
eukprot:scaffold7542_cov113-Cylindrotheca_fusiformis.AAC.6